MDESQIPPSLREEYPLRALPRPHSLTVRMDITNKCNLDCIHCTLALTRSSLGESVADMPVETFGRIADQLFPYARLVQLSCEAEPSMHKRFLEILDVVGRHRETAFILTTNGTLLSERTLRAFLDCNLAGLNISIDGATAATFAAIRKRGRFDQVVKAIELINRMKEEHGRTYPLLQINYTLMRSTLAELPRMVDLCVEWKVHRLTLQHVYAVAQKGLDAESLSHDRARSDAILAECQARCEAAGILTTFPPLFNAKPTSKKDVIGPSESPVLPSCQAPWHMMRIRWNGEVHPCDLWGQTGIGDFNTQSFEEIWASPDYIRLRWDHVRRLPSHPKCRNCTMVTTDNLEGKAKRTPLVLTPDRNSRVKTFLATVLGRR